MAEATEPDDEKELATVTSADGTEIAYERSGSGPPLVLVHGSTSNHTMWEPVRPGFADHFTICAMDRRGHGESEDADEYGLEREVEDVVAVVESIEEPLTLLGYSFGGLPSLEAALLTDNLHALVLYEPGGISDQEIVSDAQFDELTSLVEDGESEQALVLLRHDIVGLAPVEIDELRDQPNWQNRVERAHLLVREIREIREYEFDPARFADVTTSSLQITGSESRAAFQDAMATVDEVLPNSRLVTLEGHGHVAIDTAPDRFIDEVVSFTSEVD